MINMGGNWSDSIKLRTMGEVKVDDLANSGINIAENDFDFPETSNRNL